MTSVDSLCQAEHIYVASNFDMSVALICFPCTSRSMGELHASTYSWLHPLRSNEFTGGTWRHVKTTFFGAGTVIVLACVLQASCGCHVRNTLQTSTL